MPRIALYPVRGAWTALWALPRLGMWAYDRYQVEYRVKQIFFNDQGTVGLYPVAFVETGFGLNAGVRLIVRDLSGRGERLRLRASYGGLYRQRYSAKLTSGSLLGDRLALELNSEYEIFPRSRFAGLGNGALQEPQPGMALIIDPLAEDTAIATRYRHDDVRVALALLWRAADRVTLRASAAYKHRTFGPNAAEREDPSVMDFYDTSRLIGFDSGLSNVYGELELSYDSRRVTRFYLSPAAPSTGWKLTAFAGYQRGLDHDPSRHARWGADAQRYLDLYGGDRVLLVRAHVEGVTGAMEDIPFVDLPSLGGPLLLRGYTRDRYRDRHAGLVSVEYAYPLYRNAGAYLFVDAGRVGRTLGELADATADTVHLGFGGGVQIHTMHSFLARVFVASSVDGGVIFNLSFDPVFDARAREEQR